MGTLFKRSILTMMFVTVFLTSMAYAVVESWKPAQPGGTYTATFRDDTGTTVTGEFTSEVDWEQKANGKLNIKKWDKNATFKYTGEDGKTHKVRNGTVKQHITSLNTDFTGSLSGNIKEAPAKKKSSKHSKKSKM